MISLITNLNKQRKSLSARVDNRLGGEQGFTLIELLITMLVAAVLAVAVIFALGGFVGQAQGSNGETMASLVKTTAIARSTFDNGGTFYGITAAQLNQDQNGVDITATDPVHLATFTPEVAAGTACTSAAGCVGFSAVVDASDNGATDTYTVTYNGTSYSYTDNVKGVAGTW